MYKPFTVTPSPEERRALLEMSKQDVRPPHDQIRFLIISEAIKRGLLPTPTNRDADHAYEAAGVSQ